MSFNSLQFLIFLPIVVLGYYIMPKKIKNIWLLIASYYFYMCWNAKCAVLIFTSTLITYLSGIMLEKIKHTDRDESEKKRLKNLTVALSFVTNLGILAYFKYANFLLDTLKGLFSLAHITLNISAFDIILPVGISFYTFQALSYTMDVYRDEIYAESNFINYALFVSFFPQLVAGPIERSKNLLKQLNVAQKFSYDNLREGVLIMIWGFFLKIVIADRAATFVDTVYAQPDTYRGWYIIVATLLFSIQIYCDFYGYSSIAKGAAKILGIDLMENFEYPFLRETTAELWRGWHVSLTTWFRDYLYFPLGGSRKGKVRKYINLMIVFLASGLWHGASFTYVIWGGLSGLFQVIGEIIKPLRHKICDFLGMDYNSLANRILRIAVTYMLFNVGVVFFRSDSIGHAISAVREIFTAGNPWIFFDGSLLECGINGKNFTLLLICIAILLFADICKKNNIILRNVIIRQHAVMRVLIVAASVLFIIVFGIWGPAYDLAGFIYFQF